MKPTCENEMSGHAQQENSLADSKSVASASRKSGNFFINLWQKLPFARKQLDEDEEYYASESRRMNEDDDEYPFVRKLDD